MALQDLIYQAISDEIANDPMNVGYKGHTDDEIALMLNNPVPRSATNFFTEQSPMSRILSGVGNAPNVVITIDVTSSKLVTPKPPKT